MKSIALCENTLIEKSENGKEVSEDMANEKILNKTGKKLTNGNSEDKKLEAVIKETDENLEVVQNGSNKTSSEKSNDENTDSHSDGEKTETNSNAETEDGESENLAKNIVNRSNSSDTGEVEIEVKVETVSDNEFGFSETNELLEEKNSFDLNAQASSEESQEAKYKEENSKELEKAEVIDNFKQECTFEEEQQDLAKESLVGEIKVEKQPESDVEDIILDDDENKENEKEEKDCPEETEQSNELSSKCEIQVGECQTVPDADKDLVWLDKPEQDVEEDSLSFAQDPLAKESDTASVEKDEAVTEKEVTEVKEVDETEDEGVELEEVKVNGEEKSEEEGGEDTTQMDVDESYLSQTAVDSEADGNTSDSQAGSGCGRKRQLSQEIDEAESIVKKTKLSEEGSNENEQMEYSSRHEDSASQDATGTSKDSESEVVDDTNSSDDKTGNKEETSKDGEAEETTKTQEGKQGLTSSFLANLRGTLKSLTRSDLEELIVQKLCEVITERSTVGELRRKAQALEQDQERWKGKVQSLTKLVREMEMVMKKYMTEVQKQTKGGESPVVTPIKVTRSVGLQVSFYSSANKGPKPNPAQPATPNVVANPNGKNAKPSPSKIAPQMNIFPKNPWNKPVNQKTSPLPQKPILNHHQQQQQKRPMTPRNDYGIPQQNRPILPQPAMNNSCPAQTQAQTPRPNKVVSATQTSQQQNGSKVIDLTDDDDRQTGNIGKTQGPIRVVNHLPQAQVQNNRFAYILPATSAPTTGTTPGQSRQVLIATPTVPQTNRQLMCSMPPLLFKGGNVVQQPGTQPQVLSQPQSRVIFPKPLKHPAPLPQPPLNQLTRPNLKLLPPRPALKISKVQTGIVLSWNMSLSPDHAPISSYQLYAYQESNSPPATSLWKKVGDVKALPLPMACTLTQFMSGHKYHFAVRAVDLHSRIGPFSFPGTIVLVK